MHATRLLALCLITACYETPKPDCGFGCGPAGECPDDYQCASDGVCHRVGTPASLVCAVDARIPDDAAVSMDGPDDAPVDGDLAAPTVMSTSPADLATAVPRDTTITVVFSEPVVGVDLTSFLVDDGAAVAGAIAIQSPTTYVFTPTTMLAAAATVTVSLTAAIMDTSGNDLAATSFTFVTGT